MSAAPAGPEAPTVIKVGGSLLDLPELPRRIGRLLRAWPGSRPVILAGGGAAADLARSWDGTFRLGEERAHRLALSAMALNGSLLAEILPRARCVKDRGTLGAAWEAESLPVLDPRAFLGHEEPLTSELLPHLWAVTSDSVAAWIASRLGAWELMLLKSRAPPEKTLHELAACGYVDPHLPALAARIPTVSAVNLRSEEVVRVVLER